MIALTTGGPRQQFFLPRRVLNLLASGCHVCLYLPPVLVPALCVCVSLCEGVGVTPRVAVLRPASFSSPPLLCQALPVLCHLSPGFSSQRPVGWDLKHPECVLAYFWRLVVQSQGVCIGLGKESVPGPTPGCACVCPSVSVSTSPSSPEEPIPGLGPTSAGVTGLNLLEEGESLGT